MKQKVTLLINIVSIFQTKYLNILICNHYLKKSFSAVSKAKHQLHTNLLIINTFSKF
jgi:hypothetical protein